MVDLKMREIGQGRVVQNPDGGLRLSLQQTTGEAYSLAQVDNYMHLPRRRFPCMPPVQLSLEARVSNEGLPGTWGFGLWNDPFSLGIGGGGMQRVLPVLPNAAWFFYGSSRNYLSLRDDGAARGFHAGTYRSPRLPGFFSLLGLPLIPFLFWPAASRWVRRITRLAVQEDSAGIDVSARSWHRYTLKWSPSDVQFLIDRDQVFRTSISPRGRLGVVIWIDNQFMHFGPDGRLGFGCETLPALEWLSIRELTINETPVLAKADG